MQDCASSSKSGPIITSFLPTFSNNSLVGISLFWLFLRIAQLRLLKESKIPIFLFFIIIFNECQRLNYEQYGNKLTFAFRHAHSEIFFARPNVSFRYGRVLIYFFLSRAKSKRSEGLDLKF